MAYTDGPQADRVGVVRTDIVGEAWQKVIANVGMWMVASLVMFLLVGVISSVFYSVGYIPLAVGSVLSGDKEPSPIFIVGALFFMLMVYAVYGASIGIFLGGMVKIALKQLRGQPLNISDLFGAFSYGVPLALASMLYALGVILGSFLLVVPALLFAGVCLLTMPLIVDQRMDAVKAMSTSIKMLSPQMGAALLTYFLLSLLAGVGYFACGIGFLATFPILPMGMALVYRDSFPERFQNLPDPEEYR